MKTKKTGIFVAISFCLVVSFCFSSVAFADETTKKLILTDKDFINITEEQGSGDTRNIFSETRDGSGLDWITYVIKLDPKEVGSPTEFSVKASDKRTLFSSEKDVVGVVYAPAKSYFRYLDISSVLSGVISDAVFGSNLSERVKVSSTDGNIYIVRSYSGASGIRSDQEESAFVDTKVDQGKERARNAWIVNVISGGFEASDALTPIGVIGASTDAWKSVVREAVLKVITENTAKGWLAISPEGGGGANEILRVMSEMGQAIFSASMGLGAQTIKDAASRSAIKNLGKFMGNIATISLRYAGKAGKGGQVADRAYDLVYNATPLETAYVINAPLVENEKPKEMVTKKPEQELLIKTEIPKTTSANSTADGVPTTETSANIVVLPKVEMSSRKPVITTGAGAFYVESGYPSEIGTFRTVMNGTVSSNENKDVVAWFEYGKNGTFEKSTLKIKLFFEDLDFTGFAYYLENNTIYSYRAVAQKDNIIAYGDVHTFNVGSPSGSFGSIERSGSYTAVYNKFNVATGYPSEVGLFQTVFNGFVSENKDKNVVAWFEYGKNGTFEKSTQKTKLFFGNLDFTGFAYYPEKGATYSYRAVARIGESGNLIYGETHTITIPKEY